MKYQCKKCKQKFNAYPHACAHSNKIYTEHDDDSFFTGALVEAAVETVVDLAVSAFGGSSDSGGSFDGGGGSSGGAGSDGSY